MSVFSHLGKVRLAQQRLRLARDQVSTPAAALLARGKAYPLTTVGVAAGAGFVAGSLDVHPLRVPGVRPLLGGGLAQAIAYGTQLLAGLGTVDLASLLRGADRNTTEDVGDPLP